MGNQLFIETIHPVKGSTPIADLYNGSPSTDVINTRYCQKVVFVLHQAKNATSTAGTATITVEACSSAAGSNATAIAFKYSKMTTGADDTMGAITAATTAGFATTANEDTAYFIEIDSADLPAAYPYVRLHMAELVNAPVIGSVMAYCLNLDYAGVSQPTMLT
jgi:hypothetical protein